MADEPKTVAAKGDDKPAAAPSVTPVAAPPAAPPRKPQPVQRVNARPPQPPPVAAEPPTEPPEATVPQPPPVAEMPALPEPPAPVVLTHEPSGEECRVPHADGEGPCQRCKHCRVKMRPREMAAICPKRTA